MGLDETWLYRTGLNEVRRDEVEWSKTACKIERHELILDGTGKCAVRMDTTEQDRTTWRRKESSGTS